MLKLIDKTDKNYIILDAFINLEFYFTIIDIYKINNFK